MSSQLVSNHYPCHFTHAFVLFTTLPTPCSFTPTRVLSTTLTPLPFSPHTTPNHLYHTHTNLSGISHNPICLGRESPQQNFAAQVLRIYLPWYVNLLSSSEVFLKRLQDVWVNSFIVSIYKTCSSTLYKFVPPFITLTEYLGSSEKKNRYSICVTLCCKEFAVQTNFWQSVW